MSIASRLPPGHLRLLLLLFRALGTGKFHSIYGAFAGSSLLLDTLAAFAALLACPRSKEDKVRTRALAQDRVRVPSRDCELRGPVHPQVDERPASSVSCGRM